MSVQAIKLVNKALLGVMVGCRQYENSWRIS